MRQYTRFLLLALVVSLTGMTARAENFAGRHFMVVFGYQGPGNRAVDSHTFASFYRGDELGMASSSTPLTISWLPATGIVRPIRRERGRNFSLRETLSIARSNGYQVAAYGPYEISADLYRRAQNQVQYLNSGAVLYKMINGPFAGNAINCINAVGDIAGGVNTGTQWGFAASATVTAHLARFMTGYPHVHHDVSAMIRLNEVIRGH